MSRHSEITQWGKISYWFWRGDGQMEAATQEKCNLAQVEVGSSHQEFELPGEKYQMERLLRMLEAAHVRGQDAALVRVREALGVYHDPFRSSLVARSVSR